MDEEQLMNEIYEYIGVNADQYFSMEIRMDTLETVVERLSEASKLDLLRKLVWDIEEGLVYEPRPGRLRYLG
jgi:hypothetical protein